VDIKKLLKLKGKKKERLYGKRVDLKHQRRYVKVKLPQKLSNDIALMNPKSCCGRFKSSINVKSEDNRQ
jgi:magnesium chelatase subunit D